MRTMRSGLVAWAVGSMLLSGVAAAQSAPSAGPPAKPAGDKATDDKATDDKDIVVTARKQVEKSDALQYARDASAPVDRQLARFNALACPMAIGFPPKAAAEIVERMRDVATAAGAKLAPVGCKGNMVLIAATDGRDMLQQMRRLRTPLIDGLSPRAVRALIAEPGPVRSWTLTAVENEDGVAPQQSGGGWPVLHVFTASNLNPPTQQAIDLAVVVIDWSAMFGKSTTQIADYAAMRTLAKTNPVKAGGPVETILTLFDGTAAGPVELGEADLVYLQSLYQISGMHYAHFQIGEISSGVKKASKVAP